MTIEPEAAPEESGQAGDGGGGEGEASPSTEALIEKMRAVLIRRLEKLESEPMETGDKEMTLLGSMARTLGKLEDLQRSQKAETRTRAAPSPEMIAIRKKIAERIDQLNRG